MYFPDDRCCDRSGADGGALMQFEPEALPLRTFSDGLSGSQPCGGYLHPAAALLQRVLRHRADDNLYLIQRAI
jgi:hypothetical protein